MSSFYPIQESFLGGVLSPKAQGQVSSERYATGLDVCRNFIPTFQGSLKLRAGSRYVATINATETRLFDFSIPSLEDDAAVLVTDTQVELYTRAGAIIDGLQLFKNPAFSLGLFSWTVDIPSLWNVDFIVASGLSAYAQVTGDAANPSTISQRVVTDDATKTHRLRALVRYEYKDIFPSAVTLTVNVGTTEFGSEIDQFVYDLTDEALNNFSINEVFVPTVPNTQFYVTFSITCSGSDITFYVAETQLLDSPSVAPVAFVSPWAKEQLSQIQSVTDPSAGEMYFVHPNVAPYRMLRSKAGIWTFEIVPFKVTAPAGEVPAAPPVEWTGENWPSVCGIYQSRLYLGATPEEPSRLWGSRVGNYLDFTLGANPDDALDFSLLTKGSIEWLADHKILIIGVSTGEWISFGVNGAITPDDYQFIRQSGYGTASVQHDLAGRHVLYVSANRQKVRSLYDDGDNSNGWASNDIAFFAENLLAARILEVSYALEPNYQMWCLMADGTCSKATYNPDWGDSSVIAWHQYVTEGVIDSLTAVSSIEGDSTFMVVRRANGLFLEYVTAEESIEQYTDSYVVRNVQTTANFNGAFDGSYGESFDGGLTGTTRGATGLAHLEGQTVRIMALQYDAVTYELLPRAHPDRVVTGGTVALEDWCVGVVFIGLGIDAIAVTLPIDGGNQAGTGQGDKRRFNRIFGRFVNSASPLIDGRRLRSTIKTSWGTDTDYLINQDEDVRVNGFTDGVITFTQDLPIRTEIAALFGKVASSAT